jgi:hypothetical protein
MRRNWVKAALAGLALTVVSACAHNKEDDKPKVAPEETATNSAKSVEKSSGFLGLGGKKENAGPCPLLGVLYDAARLVELKGAEEKYANVGFTGEVRGIDGLCSYVGAAPIKMNLNVDFAFGRGPASGSDHRVYRYWVAVTARDRVPLAKQYFDVDVTFPKGVDRVTTTENIDKIVIPRAKPDVSGANFEILVGFDLTPEQVAFNREGKRFRIDAGAAN